MLQKLCVIVYFDVVILLHLFSCLFLFKEDSRFGHSQRKLPQSRSLPLVDPVAVATTSVGHLSIQQLSEVLGEQRSQEPGEVATKYGVDRKDINNLLLHYSSFVVMGTLKKPEIELKFHPLHK